MQKCIIPKKWKLFFKAILLSGLKTTMTVCIVISPRFLQVNSPDLKTYGTLICRHFPVILNNLRVEIH